MAATSAVSAQERATEGIRHFIRANNLTGGARLPAERELAEMCGVSRTALRAAITQMIARNELEARLGSGTYVCPPKPTHLFQSTYNFSESVRRAGLVPGAQQLSAGIVRASAQVAQWLGIRGGEPVYEVRRLRTANALPVSIENVYLNHALCPGIEEVDFSNRSIYEYLFNVYGLKVAHGEERISITRATPQEARLLDIAPETPVFFQRALERTTAGEPLEYSNHVIRSDRYRFASNHMPPELRREVSTRWLLS